MRRFLAVLVLLAVLRGVALAQYYPAAQPIQPPRPGQMVTAYYGPQIQRFWHYPYYYFPHNYWPTLGPRYPEGPNMPYMRPPAYMAYPPFREPNWRYEFFQPQKYHRGHHFWLDQF